ncbi:hypothetical protein NZ698_16995 [Chryseobacterium sp. PBS4-4]|uniref:Uncharacterized protein n=1 Tax=Chryseobacterium edaphi TaxID=2976532 RepID=A0ABT2W9J6_9FLAO|nr:hypothetical protein [Chryseobacterium edaphi]MCU7618880.1 hypothetical protein [Chryseobacterium edaphi]
MKKLIIMSAFALMASASFTNTQAQVKPGNGAGQLFLMSDGCYYVVKHHSMLWGLIEWDSEPEQVWCGPGFGLGW